MRTISGISSIMLDDSTSLFVVAYEQSKPIVLGIRHRGLHGREVRRPAHRQQIEVVTPANEVFDRGEEIGRTGEIIVRHPHLEAGGSAPISVGAVLDDLTMGFSDRRARHSQRSEYVLSGKLGERQTGNLSDNRAGERVVGVAV